MDIEKDRKNVLKAMGVMMVLVIGANILILGGAVVGVCYLVKWVFGL